MHIWILYELFCIFFTFKMAAIQDGGHVEEKKLSEMELHMIPDFCAKFQINWLRNLQVFIRTSQMEEE